MAGTVIQVRDDNSFASVITKRRGYAQDIYSILNTNPSFACGI